MEIRAALEAVRSLDGPLVVVSDSTYVVNCFRDDKWWHGWLRRDRQTSARKPVAAAAAATLRAGRGRAAATPRRTRG